MGIKKVSSDFCYLGDIQGEGAREVLVKKFLLIDRIRFLEN